MMHVDTIHHYAPQKLDVKLCARRAILMTHISSSDVIYCELTLAVENGGTTIVREVADGTYFHPRRLARQYLVGLFKANVRGRAASVGVNPSFGVVTAL